MEVKRSEDAAMALIAGSGNARTLAFRALASAREGDFEEALALIKSSEEAGVEAHRVQTSLLVEEANGIKTDMDILMVHAQDHLMTSLLAQELISEIIHLYQVKVDKRKEEL